VRRFRVVFLGALVTAGGGWVGTYLGLIVARQVYGDLALALEQQGGLRLAYAGSLVTACAGLAWYVRRGWRWAE
jgi:hypothetical protein